MLERVKRAIVESYIGPGLRISPRHGSLIFRRYFYFTNPRLDCAQSV